MEQSIFVRRVLDAFGLGVPRSVRALGGTATPKFAVDAPRGRFVVRMRPAEFASEAWTGFDHQSLARLAAEGLPVPRPQSTPEGKTWIRVDEHVVEVLAWVDGQPFEWTDLTALGNVGRFLARFHAALSHDIPPGKEGFLREDHPDSLVKYVPEIERLCPSESRKAQVRRLAEQLDLVREHLDGRLWPQLPKAVIHGDVHPGNMRFKNSDVAAVYDFDYLSMQARVRDLCDALMFFASPREVPLDPDDIYSLTQPFQFDIERTLVLFSGYHGVTRLEDCEWEAIPWIVRSLWVQNRLRGGRKVPQERKASFVLDRCFEIIDWLDEKAPEFFQELRSRLHDGAGGPDQA